MIKYNNSNINDWYFENNYITLQMQRDVSIFRYRRSL